MAVVGRCRPLPGTFPVMRVSSSVSIFVVFFLLDGWTGGSLKRRRNGRRGRKSSRRRAGGWHGAPTAGRATQRRDLTEGRGVWGNCKRRRGGKRRRSTDLRWESRNGDSRGRTARHTNGGTAGHTARGAAWHGTEGKAGRRARHVDSRQKRLLLVGFVHSSAAYRGNANWSRGIGKRKSTRSGIGSADNGDGTGTGLCWLVEVHSSRWLLLYWRWCRPVAENVELLPDLRHIDDERLFL